jgi:bacterioferritin-associated ferredoxin
MRLRISLNLIRSGAMILCVCQAVTDREVDAAVRGGARSVDAVAACCGAGTDCGACRDAIQERIEDSCSTCPRRGASGCRSTQGAFAPAA